jgi:hypothetical protein
MEHRLNMANLPDDPRGYEDGDLVLNGEVVGLNQLPHWPALEPTEGRIRWRLRVATYGLPKAPKPLRTEHMKGP